MGQGWGAPPLPQGHPEGVGPCVEEGEGGAAPRGAHRARKGRRGLREGVEPPDPPTHPCGVPFPTAGVLP